MKIALLGLGKMGGWLAAQLSQEHEIVGFDTKTQGNAPVRMLTQLSDLRSFAPEMLINAVSLQNTRQAFESVLPYLSKSCILSDLASVKQDLPECYRTWELPFVSVHPMFGPTHVAVENLREENAVIINESDGAGRDFFIRFFAHLGVKVFECSFKEHDKMMAYSLTTPFVASLVFASCVDQTAVPGTNFARHKKIAQGLLSEDDHLLAEVLFNPQSVSQLEAITSRLEFLKHVIRDRDNDEMRRLFEKLRKNLNG